MAAERDGEDEAGRLDGRGQKQTRQYRHALDLTGEDARRVGGFSAFRLAFKRRPRWALGGERCPSREVRSALRHRQGAFRTWRTRQTGMSMRPVEPFPSRVQRPAACATRKEACLGCRDCTGEHQLSPATADHGPLPRILGLPAGTRPCTKLAGRAALARTPGSARAMMLTHGMVPRAALPARQRLNPWPT